MNLHTSSLPLDGRLATLRARGAERPLSLASASSWLSLTQLGIDVALPFSGRPGVRGAPGQFIGWGEGWFGQIRDGGVGWNFDRSDSQEVATRTHILLKLFRKSRADCVLALEDAPAQICNS